MRIDRRTFLRGSVTGGAFLALQHALPGDTFGQTVRSETYGPLVRTPSLNTGESLIALPPGFQYTAIGRRGSQMADGNPTPPRPDGMSAFQVRGELRLVRNHEEFEAGTRIARSGEFYDTVGRGGTTTLVVDPRSRLLVRDFVSLSGTSVNCAGGFTPWGSWITCEETTEGPGAGFQKKHGYCFEVPSDADGPVAARPLTAMGRFRHEAIAIDPASGIVYLTEDLGGSGFYRFLPNTAGRLADGGRLQMLAILDRPRYDTQTGQLPGIRLPVYWVDIAEPDPVDAEFNLFAVYNQGRALGAAKFARLEGAYYASGRIVFVATNGGDKGLGQIWEYLPYRAIGARRRAVRSPVSGVLRLVYESTDINTLKAPDNLCMSPRGSLLLCEDGPTTQQYLRGLTSVGEIFDFARYDTESFGRAEFAGATFSPDGETLFVNLQGPDVTLAIWGPWTDGRL